MKFIDRCVLGEVKDPNKEIDDEIDKWHESQERLPPLHQWLGMSWSEYKEWILDNSYLEVIIYNRKGLKK